jgi:hypothetical protein
VLGQPCKDDMHGIPLAWRNKLNSLGKRFRWPLRLEDFKWKFPIFLTAGQDCFAVPATCTRIILKFQNFLKVRDSSISSVEDLSDITEAVVNLCWKFVSRRTWVAVTCRYPMHSLH